MPSNEDLALAVQAGQPGAILELWEAVQRLIRFKAKKRANNPACRTSFDDLVQVGFLAMVDTAEKFDPSKGYAFNTALNFYLKRRFNEADGVRTSKRDALMYSKSIDEPLSASGDSDTTIGELVPDDGAALAFMGVEYADFLDYCRGVIYMALERLTESQAGIIRAHYFKGKTLKEIGRERGISTAAASNIEQSAFTNLYCGRYGKELRECLDAFMDFHTLMDAATNNRWRQTGYSRTEAAAFIKAGG